MASPLAQRIAAEVGDNPEAAADIIDKYLPGAIGGLTPVQAKAFEFIVGFIRQFGVSPSREEIARTIGAGNSKSSATRVVRQLIERGAITELPHRARSIRVFPRGEAS